MKKKILIGLIILLLLMSLISSCTKNSTHPCCCASTGTTYFPKTPPEKVCTPGDKLIQTSFECGSVYANKVCFEKSKGEEEAYIWKIENHHTLAALSGQMDGIFKVVEIKDQDGQIVWTPSGDEITGVFNNYELASSSGNINYYTGGHVEVYYDGTPDYDPSNPATAANGDPIPIITADGAPGGLANPLATFVEDFSLDPNSGIAQGYLHVTGGSSAPDLIKDKFGPGRDIYIYDTTLTKPDPYPNWGVASGGKAEFGILNVPEFSTIGVVVGVLAILALTILIKTKKKK